MQIFRIFSRQTGILLRLKTNKCKMATANFIELSRKRPVDYKLAAAIKSEIEFKVFSHESPEGTNITEIEKLDLNINLPTKVFIHGWNSKGNWYDAFKEEYFKKGGHNVIYVDWSEPGTKEYGISAANVKPVGEYIGDFIIASKVHLSKIHLVGKSLGAQVAAHVGKHIQKITDGQKIGRITGLDPAAPKFECDDLPETDRLNKTDAEFVDVIHTDVGYYGFERPMGSVDFYPNGGGLQPGCESDDEGHDESHGRSNWYFLESINTNEIKAYKADSWSEFANGKFNDDDYIVFGENIPLSAEGNYYFKTKDTKPYTSHI